VKLRYHIRALSEQELGDYIRHRLSIVGAAKRTQFPPETLPLLYKYAGGIPRLINTLCDTTLTCAYADSLPAITSEVVEAAAKELQWESYAARVDKQRMRATPVSNEGGVRGLLQEQAQKLGVIADRVGKIEELSPALQSIERSLAAIESHLRNLARGQGMGPRSDSAANPRQKSG
jgi:hypothetical protein